jgi:hypothetical protein
MIKFPQQYLQWRILLSICNEPTHACLAAIEPYFTKGSVIACQEANYPQLPRETLVLREVLGLGRCSIRRMP